MQLIAIVATLSALIGFSSGYWLKDTVNEAEKAELYKQALITAKKQIKVTAELEKEFTSKEAETKIVYRDIIKRVVKYVPAIQTVNSECNLSVNAVKLLDFSVENKLPSTTAIVNGKGKSTAKD